MFKLTTCLKSIQKRFENCTGRSTHRLAKPPLSRRFCFWSIKERSELYEREKQGTKLFEVLVELARKRAAKKAKMPEGALPIVCGLPP